MQLINLLFKLMVGWSFSSAFNLDAISASTHARIEKKFRDQLSTKTPLNTKLKEKDGLDLVDGGKELTYPLILGRGNAGSYYGDDKFNVSRPEGIQSLTFSWKQFYSTIRIDGIEEIMNAGEGLGAKLFEGRMEQAEITTAEDFETMLFADGTGNVGGDGTARDWNGLQNLVADDPTTGTIGGLSRSTYSKIRNQAYTTAVTGFNTAQAGRNALTTLWANCTQGQRSPNFITTTVAIWVLYQLSLTTNERYVMEGSDKKLTSAGFPNVAFMTAPVTMSSACPASHLYMLRIAKPKSTGGIFLVVSSQRNFKMESFIKPIDADYRVAKVLTAGNLAVDAPYLNGVATNITG